MAAFLVATSKIKDPLKFGEYGAGVRATLAPFNGELVIRGKAAETLMGASNPDVVGVLRFPDMATLHAWHNSPAYQALVPLRDDAVEMTLVAYEEPA